MTKTTAALIAIDGVDEASLLAAAREEGLSTRAPGISRWDASGVFQDLSVADAEAGTPSARVLLLLYAADLAFRLRWEIRPALAEGRTVVAAPYLQTAFAFGRAAGLPVGWIMNLFKFAPKPNEQYFAALPDSKPLAKVSGFVAFSCRRMANSNGFAPRDILARTAQVLSLKY